MTDPFMNTTKLYVVDVHSFLDLVTNSSTEIFISANEATVKALKDLVNNILKAGGSAVTADMMFDFTLAVEDPDSYPSKFYPVDSEEGKRVMEENEGANYDRGPKLVVLVKPKIEDCPEIVSVAKQLANLTGLYEIDAWRDG